MSNHRKKNPTERAKNLRRKRRRLLTIHQLLYPEDYQRDHEYYESDLPKVEMSQLKVLRFVREYECHDHKSQHVERDYERYADGQPYQLLENG